MPTNNQSQIQGLIEGLTSLNSNAQNAQPNNPNNGDPATVYNIPAMSNAAGNWWIPPAGSGVDMQAILSQLPQGQQNSNINNILGNLTRPPAGPAPGGPGSGVPPQGPGGVVPPGQEPGTTPPGVVPMPGSRPPSVPVSVGDISGPTYNRPWDFANNYNNAMPNTGQNMGRNAALPWAQTSWGSAPLSGQPGGADVMNALRGLGSQLSGELQGAFNSFIGDITGQNGWQGILGQLLDAVVPGAGMIIDRFFPQNNPTAPMDPQAMQQTNQQLASQLNSLISGIMQRGDTAAQNRLEQLLSSTGGSLPAGWGDEQMSGADWRNLQRQGAFNQFFQSPGSGTINPITGLPSTDARGDFTNQIADNHLALIRSLNRTNIRQRR